MNFLKYDGPHQQVEVMGYGHFGPGDEKQVDDVTAGAFQHEQCQAEGWSVRSDEEPSPEFPVTQPASDVKHLQDEHFVTVDDPKS